jgi:hypothetical protein
MAGPTEPQNLDIAWKALACDADSAAWRIIPIRQPSHFTAHAARHHPGNLEALIVSFPGAILSPTRRLPEGTGFDVMKPDAIEGVAAKSAIALVRSSSGPLDIFLSMSNDILALLDRTKDLPAPMLMERFLDRVVAWQLFMAPPRGGPLSLDAQTGLFGELYFLRTLLDRDVPASHAVIAWDGPLHGAQDFRIGSGAVEVKSSAAIEGFAAKINSLEQLDDSDGNPLFLLALRFEIQLGSIRLPDLVSQLRERFSSEGTLTPFEGRLRAVGYEDIHASDYDRPLALTEQRAFRMGQGFPRLFRGNIAAGIRRGSYEIEIDATVTGLVTEDELFASLGLK